MQKEKPLGFGNLTLSVLFYSVLVAVHDFEVWDTAQCLNLCLVLLAPGSKNMKTNKSQAVMANTFNPSTWEAEAG